MKKTAIFITTAAIVAALYVVLSLLTYTFSYLEIQCRIAEALCMTIFYTPAGIFGVVIGCFITNIIGGSPLDMIFGTAATLIAALLTYPIVRTIRKKHGPVLKMKHALLIPIPTVLVNAIIIPFVLYFGFGVTSFWGNKLCKCQQHAARTFASFTFGIHRRSDFLLCIRTFICTCT